MENVWILTLTVFLLYGGIAIQTFLDLLSDEHVRRKNSVWLLLGKTFVWPLILLDKVRVNGLMSRVDAAAHNAKLADAAGAVGGGIRQARKAQMEQARDEFVQKHTKNSEKRKERKRKRKKKRR